MEPAIKLPPDRYETRVTPLWTFANHPNKQAVYDKHRDFYVDYDWWDNTYDHFIELMAEKGVDVEGKHIYFTGFWSQGDGACFTQCRIDWTKYLPTLNGKYPLLQQFADDIPHPSMYHRGNYYHEYSVSISLETMYVQDEILWNMMQRRFPKAGNLFLSPYYQSEDFLERWQRYESRIIKELNELEDEIGLALRSDMKTLYASLETEYDYLTSDEYLKERFSDSDYMFDEEGNIHN